jgi:hypothetical protein
MWYAIGKCSAERFRKRYGNAGALFYVTNIVGLFLSACVSHKNIASFAACPQAPTKEKLLGRRSSD